MLCTLRRHEAKHIASSPTMQPAYIPPMPEPRAPRPYRVHRRTRLAALIEAHDGPKELARLVYGKDDANDTHLIACSKGRRDIGDDLAGDLETATGHAIGWMDSDPAQDALPSQAFDRASFIARQLAAITDPAAREHAMVLCENLAALAQAGQLQAVLSGLQFLTPSAPDRAPIEPQPLHRRPQSADGRAGPT